MADNEIAHVDATIAGLMAKRAALVRIAEEIPDPPDCPHCKKPLDTVYYWRNFEGFDSYEGTWDIRDGLPGWEIDHDKPSNTDENNHVCTVHCGECEGELPYDADSSDSWIEPVEVEVAPETDDDVTGLFATCNGMLNYLGSVGEVNPHLTDLAAQMHRCLQRLSVRDLT